jgi:hypothetical protein
MKNRSFTIFSFIVFAFFLLFTASQAWAWGEISRAQKAFDQGQSRAAYNILANHAAKDPKAVAEKILEFIPKDQRKDNQLQWIKLGDRVMCNYQYQGRADHSQRLGAAALYYFITWKNNKYYKGPLERIALRHKGGEAQFDGFTMKLIEQNHYRVTFKTDKEVVLFPHWLKKNAVTFTGNNDNQDYLEINLITEKGFTKIPFKMRFKVKYYGSLKAIYMKNGTVDIKIKTS